ncbi:MAG: hypothetical protein A3H70_01875 [Candidatus Komeilibacteria bacterium RIFCSPLOWO2_02_FULL_48_11]|uniref:Uncharacterized protein n=1 Tax=Candidatus Komeilibacteria bacterium RIFCSPLOWO2_02_FULL_48_11 TaxID=1798553 RepID=A0A1G2BXQ7_9BACT|nr:MAG: hypothetical protein A3H70_01875 [Candidatus Komeilibacteria bacterium RIFCSPLOWO2_02_FULL_48_11]
MKKALIFILLTSLVLVQSSVVHAAEFNPHYIISDFEMEEIDSLSPDSIQRFLESKGSYLAKYTQMVNGVKKTASQIIFEEARTYQLSPKFIMAMLQKEQSLLTDSSPSQDQLDWATGFGVCDSCSKNDPSLAIFKGFYNQVSDFAEKVRVNYLRDLVNLGRTFTGWGPGQTKTTLDGYEIMPVNNATAVLYTYNPYKGGDGRIGANFNFWRIWQRYFTRTYPDGTLLQIKGEDKVWLIQNSQRRAFISKSALYSRFDPKRVIQVSQNELDKYEAGPPIKFANYSLLRSPKGTIYLLVDDALRGIVSREVFRTLGFNPEEVIQVAEADLKDYQPGENITLASAYPAGGLLRSKKTGGVYYVKDGIKQAIIDRTILVLNFKKRKPVPVHPEELEKYPTKSPLKLADGTLITSAEDRAVYVIADGERRPIVSAEAFEKLGYRWPDIATVPQKVVQLHPLGEVLDIVVADEEKEVLGDNIVNK